MSVSYLERFLPPDYGEVISDAPGARARVGIVIPVFGRSWYLRRCLAALQQSRLSDCVICLMDETLSEVAKDTFPGFQTFSGVHSPGFDLETPEQRLPLCEVARAAAIEPTCVAFSSHGGKKSYLRPLPRFHAGSTLYVKDSEQKVLWKGLSLLRGLWPKPTTATRRLILGFAKSGTPQVGEGNLSVQVVKIFKRRHGHMYESYARGWEMLTQAFGCERLVSLDSDTVVKPYWLERLLCLHDQHASTGNPVLATGFHTAAHPTLSEHGDFRRKGSLGGVNLMFNREVWKSLVQPCLTDLHWDHRLSRRVREAGGSLLACKPSVVQHIGRFGTWSSLFGHDQALDY